MVINWMDVFYQALVIFVVPAFLAVGFNAAFFLQLDFLQINYPKAAKKKCILSIYMMFIVLKILFL